METEAGEESPTSSQPLKANGRHGDRCKHYIEHYTDLVFEAPPTFCSRKLYKAYYVNLV